MIVPAKRDGRPHRTVQDVRMYMYISRACTTNGECTSAPVRALQGTNGECTWAPVRALRTANVHGLPCVHYGQWMYCREKLVATINMGPQCHTHAPIPIFVTHMATRLGSCRTWKSPSSGDPPRSFLKSSCRQYISIQGDGNTCCTGELRAG
jgi:hypothetical protein